MNQIILSDTVRNVLVKRHAEVFHDLLKAECEKELLEKAEKRKLHPGLCEVLEGKRSRGGLLAAYGKGDFPALKKQLEQVFLEEEMDIYHLILCGDREFMEALIKRISAIDEKKQNKEYIEAYEKNTLTPGHYGSRRGQELLRDVFQYDFYRKGLDESMKHKDIKNNRAKRWLFDLLDLLEIRVCPYCNRQYTVVLKTEERDEASSETADENLEGSTLENSKIHLKKWIRPNYDHYFPKSRYPYLALSLFNLVPCCGVCNQSKGEWDTFRFPILYPYEESFGDTCRFQFDLERIETRNQESRKAYWSEKEPNIISEDSYGFCMRIDYNRNAEEGSLDSKIKNADELFHLTDFYNEHRDYIRDMKRNHDFFGKAYQEAIAKVFPGITPEQIRQHMYMMEIKEENYSKRPLARLTRDVDAELEGAYAIHQSGKWYIDQMLMERHLAKG